MDGQLENTSLPPPRQDAALIAADVDTPLCSSDSEGAQDANHQVEEEQEETLNVEGSEPNPVLAEPHQAAPTSVVEDLPLAADSGDADSVADRPETERIPNTEDTGPQTAQVDGARESPSLPVEGTTSDTSEERPQEIIDTHTNGVESRAAAEGDNNPPVTAAKPVNSPEASTSPLPLPPIPTHHIQHVIDGTHDSRPHSPALSATSSTISSIHKRSMTTSKGSNMSAVLISSALESIAASREAKRSPPLRDGIQHALELVRTNQAVEHPREIVEALRLACETNNEKLIIASLDCIAKLISYSFFAEENDDSSPNALSPPPSPGPGSRRSSLKPEGAPPQQSLVDLVVETIASVHHETSSDTVSVQIVKALLGLVLSQTTVVHHHALLQSVRTVFNVYLMSPTLQIQMLAQGSLTQIVDHVFNRCKAHEPSGTWDQRNAGRHAPWKTDFDTSSTTEANIRRQSRDSYASSKLHSESLSSLSEKSEQKQEQDGPATSLGEADVPSLNLPETDDMKSPANHSNNDAEHHLDPSGNGQAPDHRLLTPRPALAMHVLTPRDLVLKDAFLIFRALCKLSMKPIPPESEHDPKAHAYRHKVMSLQLILHILNSHMVMLVDPTSIIYSTTSHEAPTFVQQIHQHLCLALTRNAVSPVPQIFELSVEIFWRILSGMRTKLKKQIEVLLHEIFIPILEMKTSTLKQKAVILAMLSRLCQDPQALVEIYLNYDCDGDAADNIYEHLMNIISKFGTSPAAPHHGKTLEPTSPALSPPAKNQAHASNSLNAGVLAVSGTIDTSNMGLSESQLKRQALECLVAVLRSLVAWGIPPQGKGQDEQAPHSARSQTGEDSRPSLSEHRLTIGSNETLRLGTPEPADDPSRFETAKQRKTTLLEGIKKFNFKPKRGIQFLLDNGFIADSSPESIAVFLHETDGLNKAMLGEYLGEGDEKNVAIMHDFVNLMDFRDSTFVDSIRHFLQAFRLPGEAQKIDRFLLKFAERYIDGNTKTPFANADAAYVLGYSVIMLNTDAHNPQVKKRMTKQDFVKNNRGINDGSDLPEEMLSEIYDEIHSNEIVMKDEIEAKLLQGQTGFTNSLTSVGRDLQKEAYVLQTSGMSNKTETLLTMMKSQSKNSKPTDQFYSASHFVHVRPMFDVAWMSFLAGLSGPLQETDDFDVVELCIEGFRHSIRIVCAFDMDLQRNAFVTTLAKFTTLNNFGEMKVKSLEAVKALLDVAVHDGNNLKGSWREVLKCVSQLEHMQLISTGLDTGDNGKARSTRLPNEELANQSRSTHITVAADMVFSLSHYLSGTAIVDFVRALCAVSWEEIQSSGKSNHPRLFSLQKLVDISYYNMSRVRFQWVKLWEILGEHFNQVCCHDNTNVASFALDALRQLAARFLEKEELPHFKFQKDFLKPFEYTMLHNQDAEIRDMVLQCIHQMIQAKVHNLRSGWRTMFGVFSAASKVVEERIVGSAFDIVKGLNSNHFPAIVKHGAFADLTVCISDFCKIGKYQKISLSAMGMLRDTIPTMLKSPECALSTENANPDQPMDDGMIKYWYPVLFGFYNIVMNSDDLEVRRLALESLFGALKTYGTTFPVEFWDTVSQEMLFPIFSVLKNRHDLSRFNTQEDMSVWLQNTMFQALRQLIDLYTYHFSLLERTLDGLMDLLCICIYQETRALSQIGISCFQQFLEDNVTKLSPERWEKVTGTFVKLFRFTTPHQLFDDNLRAESVLTHESNGSGNSLPVDNNDGSMILPAPLSPNHDQSDQTKPMTPQDRQHIFSQIIVKCILQLLLIEMTGDLLKNADFYSTIPPDQLLKLTGVLHHSYQFARMFNEDKTLRTELWKVGFMKHLPNLLKQESTSAAALVHVLLQMYFDTRPDYYASRPQVAERLLPLGLGVLGDYNKLRPDTQGKNIAAWNPVVAEILDGLTRLDDRAFSRYLPAIYPLAIELLSRDIPTEIRQPLKAYLTRVGRAQGIIDASS